MMIRRAPHHNRARDTAARLRARAASPTARAVEIEGRRYPSVAEAARALHLSWPTVRSRLRSATFLAWRYVEPHVED
jgi:hypothetical protein